jgi:hypothetical protein
MPIPRGLPVEGGAGQGLAHQAYDRRVIEVAGRRDHDVGRRVTPSVEPVDLGPGHRGDRLLGARDEPAQRVVAVDRLGEDVVDLVTGLVLVHGDLFEDHAAFGLDVGRLEERVGHRVGQHVDREGEVVVEHPRVVAGVFLRGEGVGLAADRLDLGRDVQR